MRPLEDFCAFELTKLVFFLFFKCFLPFWLFKKQNIKQTNPPCSRTAWAPCGRDGAEGVSSSSPQVCGSGHPSRGFAGPFFSLELSLPALCHVLWWPWDLDDTHRGGERTIRSLRLRLQSVKCSTRGFGEEEQLTTLVINLINEAIAETRLCVCARVYVSPPGITDRLGAKTRVLLSYVSVTLTQDCKQKRGGPRVWRCVRRRRLIPD